MGMGMGMGMLSLGQGSTSNANGISSSVANPNGNGTLSSAALNLSGEGRFGLPGLLDVIRMTDKVCHWAVYCIHTTQLRIKPHADLPFL
jgi:hypothetical protein